MKCLNCGKELSPNAKFCAECGTMTENALRAEAAPVENPQEQPTYQPAPVSENVFAEKPAKKSASGKKIVICIVAILVVAALVIGGIFLAKWLSPKGAVDAGMDESVEEYQQAAEFLFGADLSDEVTNLEKYSMDLEIELTGGSELPAELRGAGLQYAQDVDTDGREIGMSLAAAYGGMNLAEAQILIDDSDLYVGMEDLLGQGLYGINTKTIGEDLANLGIEDETGYISALGFNLFDLAEAVQEAGGDATSEEAWMAVWKTFTEAVETEKLGKETINVNGTDIECTKYDVKISVDAMEDLTDDAVELFTGMDYAKIVEVILEEMGLPEDAVAMLMSEMDLEAFDMSELASGADELKEALVQLGDIELDVYIKGSKVMAVIYEAEIDGSAVKIGLYMGGGKHYVDDWSVVVEIDDEKMELISTGNHAGQDGKYTDETVLTLTDYEGAKSVLLTSAIEYAYEEETDNFVWTLSVPDDELKIAAEGTVNNGDGEICIDLDNVCVESYGDVVVKLAVKFRLGEYEGRVDGDKHMIFAMSESELAAGR